MTHDRAREVIFQALTDRNAAGRALFANIAAPFADAILTALSRAGLRVVPSEPSDKDVERVTRGIEDAEWSEGAEAACDAKDNDPLAYNRFLARAAICAFMAQGGDDAPP